MSELKDDSVVLDVLENDHPWIYQVDKRLEDRQAWLARLNNRLDMADTISYIGQVAIAPSRNEDKKGNTWERSIYRTPSCIREVDPVAYEPRVLSLGPYHHGKPQLRAMDELKWSYFKKFLRRNPEKKLDDYLQLVEELESKARGAYSELESPVDRKDFIQMMLLDCCFVLEFLLINYLNVEYVEEEYEEAEEKEEGKEDEQEEEEEEEKDEEAEEKEEEEKEGKKEDEEEDEEAEEEEEEGKEEDEEEEKEEDKDEDKDSIDLIGNTAWAMPCVMRDMLLLENQLPFLLLERLLGLNIPDQTPSLTEIILHHFWDLMPGKIRKTPTDIRIHHILHLLYSCTIPTSVEEDNKKSPSPTSLLSLFKMFPRGERKLLEHVQNCNPCSNPVAPVDPDDEPTLEWIPCAKKLREAGVVFKKKDKYVSFLDITFKRGVMEIPPLQIFGYIDSVFRNLIAFEQCHIPNTRPFYISAYAHLMNLVVDTPTDVQLLKQEGIIVSTLGSDEDLAILFNQLRKNTALPDTSYLTNVVNDIMSHCHKRTNRWKATLNHNYFNNPWAIISVAAAIFLFALTIMQTVLAFFSYLRPP